MTFSKLKLGSASACGQLYPCFSKSTIQSQLKAEQENQAGLTLFIRANSSWQWLDLMVLTRNGAWRDVGAPVLEPELVCVAFLGVRGHSTPPFLRKEQEKPLYRRDCTSTWSPSLEELEEWHMSLKRSGACLGSPAYPLWKSAWIPVMPCVVGLHPARTKGSRLVFGICSWT